MKTINVQSLTKYLFLLLSMTFMLSNNACQNPANNQTKANDHTADSKTTDHKQEHANAANKHMHEHQDFEELVKAFEDPARDEWQKMPIIFAALGDLQGQVVADIGAGTGYFTFPIADRCEKVIAIDIDQRFLDYIEKRKKKEKTPM